MKGIEWQLCQPEQAAKLKSLGCLQIGTWFYDNGNEKPYQWLSTVTPIDLVRSIAYTAAELGVMLPDNVPTKRTIANDFFTGTPKSIWSCKTEYNSEATPRVGHQICISGGPSEASIRASMLILLLEEQQISVEDVNSRLEAAFA